MTAVEVLLLIFGGVVFAVSFLLPQEKNSVSGEAPLSKEQIKELFDDEIRESKLTMRDMVDETVTYSVEKAERAMERISNEKLSAVSEFSDTVLTDINKNRDEVMFLYDMLNDKHESLKETASELNETTKAAIELSKGLKKYLGGGLAVSPKASAARTSDHAGAVPVRAASPGKVASVGAAASPVAPAAPASPEPAPAEEAAQPFVPFDALHVEKVSPKSDQVKGQSADVMAPGADTQEKLVQAAQLPEEPERRTAQKKTVRHLSEAVEKPEVQFSGSGGNHNEKILQLHSMNKSNLAIARELGLGVGEVKLVLDLYKGM